MYQIKHLLLSDFCIDRWGLLSQPILCLKVSNQVSTSSYFLSLLVCPYRWPDEKIDVLYFYATLASFLFLLQT